MGQNKKKSVIEFYLFTFLQRNRKSRQFDIFVGKSIFFYCDFSLSYFDSDELIQRERVREIEGVLVEVIGYLEFTTSCWVS